MIYDCFMYFDEDLILDIRLNTLDDKVDKFVVVEATKNHAGKNKKLNFKIENFSKFKEKIKYIVIDDIPTEVKSFKKNWHSNHIRDQFQRNALERGYLDCSDDDLIILFTSAMLITGKNFAKRKNAVKNSPKVNTYTPTS